MSLQPIRKRRFALAATALAATTALALAGCSASSSSTGEKVLRLGTASAPVSLDPMLQSVDPANNWFINLSYATLTHLNPDGNLVPDLAESWEYTDDTNTTLQFDLRADAKFSDGTPVDAAAVVGSIEYSLASGVNGANWMGSITSVEAVDDTTVVITTSEPNDSLPFALSQRLLLGSVISPAGVADPESLKNSSEGAGPYVLDTEATVANDTYVYVPNDNYWDQSKISWDRVEIKVVANTTAELQAMQSGDLDLFVGDASTASAAEPAGLATEAVQFGLFGVNYSDRDGTIVPALGDARVRQALSYAIDRDAIASAVGGEGAEANATLALDGFSGFSADDAAEFAYDPARAQELLAEAGYPDGFSFDFGSMSLFGAGDVAQALVEQWAAIGVTANLTTYDDLTALVTDFVGKKYPVTVYAYGSLPTYIQLKSFFTGGSNQYNPWASQDAQIDGDIAAAASADGLEAQSALYNSALHRAIVDLAWMSNIFSSPSMFIYDPAKVTGVGVLPSVATPDVAWSVIPAN